jgi:osmotically-inducible protein OsmY
MKPDRLLLSLLIPPMVLVSTATAGKTAVSDDTLHDSVALAIVQQIPGGSAINVAVKNGVVTLTGELQTKGRKAQAESWQKRCMA